MSCCSFAGAVVMHEQLLSVACWTVMRSVTVHVGQDVSDTVSHRICCSECKECEIFAVTISFCFLFLGDWFETVAVDVQMPAIKCCDMKGQNHLALAAIAAVVYWFGCNLQC